MQLQIIFVAFSGQSAYHLIVDALEAKRQPNIGSALSDGAKDVRVVSRLWAAAEGLT